MQLIDTVTSMHLFYDEHVFHFWILNINFDIFGSEKGDNVQLSWY